MRLPTLFNRERRAYEALVAAHLDDALDDGARERLMTLLAQDPARATEVRELEAAVGLLRAQPTARAPRSFALRHAPEPVPARSSLRGGLLRWAQAATVAASLALVTLIGADLTGVGSPTVALEATSPASESLRTADDADAAGQTGMALATEPTPAPGDGAMGMTALAPEEGLGLESDTPIAEPTPGPAGRSALQWAQLAAGIATALLALGTVALTATARRLR